MDPITTPKSNLIYRGDGKDVVDLPCERVIYEVSGGRRISAIHSVWQPTDEERQRIADGENIKLGILNMQPMPPVMLEVVDEGTVPDFFPEENGNGG